MYSCIYRTSSALGISLAFGVALRALNWLSHSFEEALAVDSRKGESPHAAPPGVATRMAESLTGYHAMASELLRVKRALDPRFGAADHLSWSSRVCEKSQHDLGSLLATASQFDFSPG